MVVTSRALSRRSLGIALIIGALLGALFLASQRLDGLCPDGEYCNGGGRLSLDKGSPSIHAQPSHVKSSSSSSPSSSSSSSQSSSQPSSSSPPVAPVSQSASDPLCADFPDTSNILLIMKTGASESFSKVPTQALTNLRCLPEYLVFGDMQQQVAGVTIHDSLDTVIPEVKNKSLDFELYFRQQRCPGDQEHCNKFSDTASQGWALDKYKNIHMAEKTYKMRPDYDWYLFVDADTYVVWPTIVEWLKRINPAERHYLGSVAYVGSTPFGHGGSGYLVSKASMQAMFEGQENVANKWDERITHECCGDFMFAVALKNETDVDVKNVWPTINGEKPFTLGYGEGQWCHPITTMHHIGSEEVSDFYAFEQERNFQSPMRIKDIYHRFLKPRLQSFRDDWDNTSDDWMYISPEGFGSLEDWKQDRVKKEGLNELEKDAHLNFTLCRDACFSLDECFQYKYHQGLCSMSRTIRHGVPTAPSDTMEERSMSGWDVKKIEAWVEAHDDCGEIEWPQL
ncbi:hypothetical protein B0I35DRAFT_227756 [Stachybotrys elegans]|uniref:Glycosyltransferase family 31 protein n=1 Tax=Stachybotrys elegans TaxID=80388 RepID=A0A8K0WRF0_9HYPO|nr:hypothetical protein B0I35DRAFT_227756 [Stachybotrys elegans]